MSITRQEKALAIVFSLLLTLAGLTYSNAVERISALEADRKDLVTVAQAISVQTAVIEARLASLEDAQKDLTSVISQNTKDYQAALRRWEDLLAEFIKREKERR